MPVICSYCVLSVITTIRKPLPPRYSEKEGSVPLGLRPTLAQPCQSGGMGLPVHFSDELTADILTLGKSLKLFVPLCLPMETKAVKHLLQVETISLKRWLSPSGSSENPSALQRPYSKSEM